MHPYRRFVAIGDSFTEGVGDELPDGTVRGWADLVAQGLQAVADDPVLYANLAIRGRLIAPILDDQLPAALGLGPDLLSVNGGGNDVLRARVTVPGLSATVREAVGRVTDTGVHVLVPTGVDPSARLPLGRAVKRRGTALAAAVQEWAEPHPQVTFVDNWNDERLQDPECFSVDRLHLSAVGHRRVAQNVLRALGVQVPSAELEAAGGAGPATVNGLRYYTEHVLPWVGRRLRGRSSGDGREPKQATLAPVADVLS